MKALVVYYSRTGTTRKVALEVAKKLGCDSEEIATVKNVQGAIGYVLCGKEATLKQPAEINPAKKNPSEYDIVVIGTPVWAWNVSSPVRAYLMKNKLSKVAFFCTMQGSGAKNAFAEMERLSSKPAATMELLTKEVVKGECAARIDEFVTKIDFKNKRRQK